MDLPARYLLDWALARGPGGAWAEAPRGVDFLTRDADERAAVLLTAALDDDASDALFAGGRVFAVAGGEPLVRWLLRGRWPEGLTTIALRDCDPEALAELAGAPALDHVRSLCVRDAPAPALARLLASPWPSLVSLAIFDATPLTVASIPLELVGRLHTLRIVGAPGAPTSLDLAALLGGDRRRIGELDLGNAKLSSSTLEALAGGDWSGLASLHIHMCELEAGGAALATARLGALRELRSTGVSWEQPRSLGDDAVAGILARSPLLERAILKHSDAGDAAAIAAATHGARLRVLDLDCTRVGDAGILALGRSKVLDGLERFAFDQPMSFDAAYALADSTSRAMREDVRRPYRGISTLLYWRPRPPPPSVPADGPWPPSLVRRRFRWQRHEDCGLCGGCGAGPDGPCPYHWETVVHPVEHGDEPPTEAARAWIAGRGERVTTIEQHAAEMLEALGAWGRWRGEPRVTWWVLDRVHRGCDHDPMTAPASFREIIEAVGSPELSDRGVWAHACARVRARDYPELPDPFTPARAIADLGTSIIGLDETDGLLLELRT